MSRQQSYSEAVKVKPGQSAYHGDVLLKPEKIPSDAKEGTSPDVLGWGEVAGAAHRISSGEFKFYKTESKKYIRALTDLLITHDAEGHKPIVLPPGDYCYGNAQEFNYEDMEARRVAD